jgi:hypothetical protein
MIARSAMDPVPVGGGRRLMTYGTNGWRDELHYEDESRNWWHELEVRPVGQFATGSEPTHGFIACVYVTTFALDSGNNWTQLGERTLVYRGEHLSLVAGVRAVRKACARSMLLRCGPEDE